MGRRHDVLGRAQGWQLPIERMILATDSRKSNAKGFTLIELMVGLAIAVILLILAVPTYTRWVADSQVVGAASNVADGIRFAQAEAIKRNANVEFTVGAGAWQVNLPGESDKLRVGKLAEGGKDASFTATPSTSTTVTFNAFGQVVSANASAPTEPLESIDVVMAAGSRPLGLRILIGNGAGGTGVKLCDPALPWPSDGKGCP